MTASFDDGVKSCLKKILESEDWELLSEREIRGQIQQDLNAPDEKAGEIIKNIISRDISAFLEARAANPPEGTSRDQKRPPVSAGAEANKSRKIDDQGGVPLVFDLTKNHRITVSEYRGRVQVDLREFYFKDDEWKPGPKGIALTVAQWLELAPHLNGLGTAASNKDTSKPPIILSTDPERQAYVMEFR